MRVIELTKQLGFDDPSSRLSVDSRIVIALIDGLPQTIHPALGSAFIDVITYPGAVEDNEANVHATSIASMFSGDDPKILGLSRDCRLICIGAIDYGVMNSQLSLTTLDHRLAQAIMLALSRSASVIQMSLEFSPYGYFRQTSAAISAAAKKGVRVVISAGNSGYLGQNPLLASPGVIPVAMFDEDGLPDLRTGLGLTVGMRGLLAPGVSIPVAVPPDHYGLASGTSYAASFVTAAFALLYSIYPKLTPDDVWNALLYKNYERRIRASILPPLLDIRESRIRLARQNALASLSVAPL
jgi:subtilisin family serine protease